ncbi:hypothetical protein KAM429_35000 [Aquipseudomonas alcaligenes]|uniref:Uncharacterized protein n=1 Tax=Aquipseudomonas alcaligenes TaxID=43263 RepID=A0AA37FMX4_AQUAC|nr:hypothetical protein KAM426_06700 [Pseudomonas alcaligenes]GIZ68224.1 hypothetical protein KAM428_33090 [Pseudomonas alcaligenes]GIZ72739.1 hypothetical protein KAM429_35000 [Pseudomonas alcaligenes]GIZ77090.1 hypothetical protein KAM430_34990 [Pseudomonas alcaligenes]GIZ81279.1 hypothetical protein KAM432_33270 [Pseudomonas alcaligenes]
MAELVALPNLGVHESKETRTPSQDEAPGDHSPGASIHQLLLEFSASVSAASTSLALTRCGLSASRLRLRSL